MGSQAEKILSLKNVTKNYGGKQVLKGIDLDVYKGQVIRLYRLQ